MRTRRLSKLERIRASGNSLPLALLLTMIVTIFLGMGLPTPAVYTIVAIFAPTALIQLGVAKLAAHFFCFYYACLAAITPPVALAAYAGASLSGANPNKTGLNAVKLGIVAFVIPWVFVYSPELLMVGNVLEVIIAAVTAFVGVYELVCGIQGYCFGRRISIPIRIVFTLASFGLIIPGTITDIVGAIPIVALLVSTLVQKGRSKSTADTSA